MKDAKDSGLRESEEIIPRNLRLLIIDDSERDPTKLFSNIELVFVPDRDGTYTVPYVSRWVQLLEMLARLRSLEFDLLSIDVLFHDDDSDPPYFYEYVQGISDADRINPMGLVYGMAAAAMCWDRQLPFAFAVHSFNAKSVKDDPVAIACYGILKAIEGHQFSALCTDGNVCQVVSAMLGEVPADGFQGVQARLLVGYRRRLREFVATTGGIDYEDNLLLLIDKCRQAVESGDGKRLRDEGLLLLAGSRRDAIRLGSLFGDHRDFSKKDLEDHIIPELLDLANLYSETQEGLYEHACECVASLEEADPGGGVFLDTLKQTIAGRRSKRPPSHADLAFATVVCTYLEMLANETEYAEGRTVLTLLDLLRVNASSQQTVDRLLKSVRASYSEAFPRSLAYLVGHFEDGKPIPERFRRCGLEYARKMVKLDGDRLPPFLKASYE